MKTSEMTVIDKCNSQHFPVEEISTKCWSVMARGYVFMYMYSGPGGGKQEPGQTMARWTCEVSCLSSCHTVPANIIMRL